MAEQSDSGQDKSEDPTEKRLKESRDKGQIARSKELNTLAVVMVAAAGLIMLGPAMAGRLLDLMRFNFIIEREALYSTDTMGLQLLASVGIGLEVIGPLFFMLRCSICFRIRCSLWIGNPCRILSPTVHVSWARRCCFWRAR